MPQVETMAPALDEGTRLAIQRTQLACERTLMAWIRTAFSMISFGFTIGKFVEYLEKQPDVRAGLSEGHLLPKVLVVLGLLSLFIGGWEFRHSMVKLGTQAGVPFRVAPVGIVASLVAVIGLFALAGLFIRLDFL
jgi:putative membrane protein